MDRTFEDAIAALRRIVTRLDEQISELGPDRAAKRRSTRLGIERDAVKSAIGELVKGPEELDDTADVPAAVAELAQYLAGGHAPPHPYAGAPGRRGGAGHCWVCVLVGHVVTHPDRVCADVGCTATHTDQEPRGGSAADTLTAWGFEPMTYPPTGPPPQ